MSKVKKVLSAALALVMAASAIPVVFAADEISGPTGPVDVQGWTEDCKFIDTWNNKSGRDAYYDLGAAAGHASLHMEHQQFTFIQTEPDQHFRFDTTIGITKNDALHYVSLYTKEQIPEQGYLTSTLGKDTQVTWPDNTSEAVQVGGWNDVPVTVEFTGDSAAVYEYDPETKTGPAFQVHFDSDDSIWNTNYNEEDFVAYLPIRVVVIDKVALISAINEADKYNEADYDPSVWRTFENAYDAAVAARDNDALTQTEVNTALQNLMDAMDILDKNQNNKDVTALRVAIEAAQAKLDEGKAGDWYLDTAVADLTALIEEGNYLLVNWSSKDIERIKALTVEITAKTADLDNQLKPADFSALDAVIATADTYLNDPDFEKKYDEIGVSAVKAAYKHAKDVAADREGKTRRDDQSKIDLAQQTLDAAVKDLVNHRVNTSITKAWIVPTNTADEVNGEVIYHKTPWYKTWDSQTVELRVQTDNNEAIKSVEWMPANWSIDDPEANIEGIDSSFDQTAVVRPTFGIGPRSFWIRAKITDNAGAITYTAPVKVRFINYNWQK